MNIIVAVDENWAIGNKDELLYHIPDDMKHFRAHTVGNVCIMGRKTLESFPSKKPLKDRTNIVLSKDENYEVAGAEIFHSKDDLMEYIKDYDSDKLYVIGGESIYNLMIDDCDTAYITKIYASKEADTYFPNLDQDNNWRVVEEGERRSHEGIEYQYITYKRT